MNKTGAIILAAGKGKRINAKTSNKVTFMLGDKPMILHTAYLLKQLKIKPIVVVIGFAKESVKNLFNGDVLFAEQKKRLGTSHGVGVGIMQIPEGIESVLVLNGDDSAFYTKDILKKLLYEHYKNKNALTLLTINVTGPEGLGRIIRDIKGNILYIAEEKDASAKQRKIKEINPGCYVFSVSFLKKYLPKVKKSSVTGEYYLVSLIDLAVKNNEKIQAIKGGKLPWRGVNTKEELEQAEKLFSKRKQNFFEIGKI